MPCARHRKIPVTLAPTLWLVATLGACSSRSPAGATRTKRLAVSPAVGRRPTATRSKRAPASAWHPLVQRHGVSVQVERRLYERGGSKHFFVHVRIQNRRHVRIGVDLRDYWSVVYPNQWGALRSPHRTVIDERRARPKPLDAAGCAARKRAFSAGSALSFVRPGGAVDYFREFNASGRADVNRQATLGFLFVSLAGQIDWTDGLRCETLPVGGPGDSDLILTTPIPWGQVPQAAHTVDPR